MEFCPKCGSILVQKRKRDGCIRCEYSAKGKIKIKITEKIKDSDKNKQLAVIRGREEVFPLVSANCKKCGNKEAYFWTVQTRSGDEAETKFFKCKECNHTWREYR